MQDSWTAIIIQWGENVPMNHLSAREQTVWKSFTSLLPEQQRFTETNIDWIWALTVIVNTWSITQRTEKKLCLVKPCKTASVSVRGFWLFKLYIWTHLFELQAQYIILYLPFRFTHSKSVTHKLIILLWKKYE